MNDDTGDFRAHCSTGSRASAGDAPAAARAVARGVALLLAAAVVAGACGSSRYRYVQNSADRVYFRVPSSWAVLDVDTSDAGSPSLPPAWQRGLDASDKPSLDHASSSPKQLAGRATVLYITAGTADQMSPSSLRSALSGMDDDPLKLADSTPDKVKVVAVTPLTTKGGLKGSRIVYETTGADGSVFTRDQTSLLDPTPYPNPNSAGAAMFKVYVFELRCEKACFTANSKLVADVVNSWQVIR